MHNNLLMLTAPILVSAHQIDAVGIYRCSINASSLLAAADDRPISPEEDQHLARENNDERAKTFFHYSL